MKVIKRDGRKEEFELQKVQGAIKKAFDATKTQYTDEMIEFISMHVTSDLQYRKNKNKLSVEDIQDSVERVLIRGGYDAVAKQFILYRKQRENIRNVQQNLINHKKIVEDYLGVSDWRVRENSTVSYSLGGLILSNSGAITANYWLSEIYDEEIANAHRNADIHIHDLSMLSGYCAGWSLKQLIQEGLGGVPGKITSSPAKHLSTLCNQMVNFLGIMQNEWAGAQAFSSFDTYLAPFVKVDNLSYEETKQAIQSFIYGVNTPSRWGCVPTDTEVLSTNGFKSYEELAEGDEIYTWNMNTKKLELNPVRKVIVKPFTGNLHMYKTSNGYEQVVTPNHRVLVYKHNSQIPQIKLSEEIFSVNTPFSLPTTFDGSTLSGIDLSDDMIQLAAMIYADGNIDIRPDGSVHRVRLYKSEYRPGNDLIQSICERNNIKYVLKKKQSFGKDNTVNCYQFYGDDARFIVSLVGQKGMVDSKFFSMNDTQARLFLKTWSLFDGDYEKFKIQCDNDNIVNAIQQIAILAGFTSYTKTRNKTTYVKIRKRNSVIPKMRCEVPWDGFVWCPNVENGTAVFRRNGNVFISGQTQAPFTNITLDWTVPNDLAELNCIVGGKELDFCYKDCQKEMDMINKAFIETMIEGDANGRGFQYPIPTYSITKDFDWSDTENNRLLFEMTAKYGTPYFSNYINSDMEPSDIRSMCCRLRLDLRELRKKSGGFFGSGESTGCYDEQTEILTQNRGWIPFKELSLSDRIYTRNPNGEIEIHNPDKLFRYEYHGNMYHFKNQKVDLLVTPNHRMVYLDKHTKEQSFVRADEYNYHKHGIPRKAVNTSEGQQYFIIPKIENNWETGMYKNKHKKIWQEMKVPMKYWLQFLGWFVSEGSLDNENIAKDHGYRVFISQKKDANIPIIKDILSHLPWKFNYSKRFGTFIITNKQLWYYLRNNVKTNCYDTRVPREIIKSCSKDQLRLLVDSMVLGDGSINKRTGQKAYYTTSYELISNLQEILVLAGYSTSGIREREARDVNIMGRHYPKEQNHKTYEITLSSGEMFYLPPDKISCVNYDGFVYCCEVANHTLLVRRNGKSAWCGNSVGVVTINMPRIAYLSKTEEEFFERLDKLMDISARSLDIKRKVINKFLDNGLYPYTKRYLGTLKNHFSTIGLVGMNEAGLNAKWIQKDMTHEECQQFAIKVLNHMREKLSDYQELYGDLFNLEATPAESTSYRLAKHDKEKYPDIITAARNCDDTPYYTNSSHLPVWFTDDIFTALDIQDELQTLYTSGTVFHAFLGEKLPSWQSAMTLVRKIAENYKLPYYTLSPTYSVCKEHGYLTGEQSICPKCGKPTEVYSRITGYYRPVQNWNDGKVQEFKDRKVYEVLTSNNKKEVLEENNDCVECSIPNDYVDNEIYLVATTTCPNCKIAVKELEEKGVKYTKIYADEDPKKAEELKVKKAPTLIVGDKRYVGVSEIKRFLKEED